MTVKDQSKLQKLQKTIRKQSTLVELSERFCTLERPAHSSISIFKEQFYTLILNTNAKDRKIIAEILSDSIYVPKAIIMFLAMEEIAIATFPLLYSPLLKSPDLNMMITNCSLAHARQIARREDLDFTNVRSLLEKDKKTDSIKVILASNNVVLEDLEINNLLKTFDDEKWQEITAKNITTIDKAITTKHQPVAKDLSSSLIKLANKGGKLRRNPEGKIASPQVARITRKQIEKQLLSSARLMDKQVFANSVEQFCGMDAQITSNFIEHNDAGMLASLLCAFEIPEISAARILLLLNQNMGRNGQVFKVVMNKYNNLDQNECIVFFRTLGAKFTPSISHNMQDSRNTRFALSLAARDRRTALLEKQQSDQPIYNEDKIRA